MSSTDPLPEMATNSDVPTGSSDMPTVVAEVVYPADFPERPTVWSRSGAIVTLLAIVTVLVAVYCWNPAAEGDGFFPKCPTYVWTGLYCPGCGTLRAMHQLLHGHILAAMGYNLVMVLLLPMVAYGLFVANVAKLTGYRLPCPRISARLTWLLFAVMMLFTILRNLPYYPCTILAP